VWFIRLGLADHSGAWWLRYLLFNPGRQGCAEQPIGKPVQVWATWFPKAGRPQTFIQGFPLADLDLSRRNRNPLHLQIGNNCIEEGCCRGILAVDGHNISWNLEYLSGFRTTLSNKGWIGFSRTPHSDAVFSGQITLDGRTVSGSPLGFGIQGHNCGYRPRDFWSWTHVYFLRPGSPPSTLEALVYDMPLGLIFRKAVLWHDGERYEFRSLREQNDPGVFRWTFAGHSANGTSLDATIDGTGASRHSLPYLKTDCSGSFEVLNNSLASAVVRFKRADGRHEELQTNTGAVLEIGGTRVVANPNGSSQAGRRRWSKPRD
jgi:hypothetical protein